jgi:hypothetical protein
VLILNMTGTRVVHQSFYIPHVARTLNYSVLNCDGDRHIGRAALEAVWEPASTISTKSAIATLVADQVGLPSIAREVPTSIIWRDRATVARRNNQEAPMPDPQTQRGDTGSLVAVRKDGKWLHPYHVLALSGYAASRLTDSHHPKGAYITPDILPSRVDQLFKEDFKRWYLK